VETLHLAIERLAELAEGEGTVDEREHLVACRSCATELTAYRRLVALASEERRRIGPPLTDWTSLSSRLREDGLVATKPAKPGVWQVTSLAARRAAAIALLVGGGTLFGRLSAGLTPQEVLSSRWTLNAAPRDAAGGRTPVLAATASFGSTEDALTVLQRAQNDYERAAAYLAVHDTSTSETAADQYRTRLAALDRSAGSFLEALSEAPQDPVINQIYLATLGAREATLTKLGRALPVGARLSRF
jgi:hypothetical protein